MSLSTNRSNEQTVKVVPVARLYLSQLSGINHGGILITSVEEQSEIENRISLKLEHYNDHGLLRLRYKGTKFNDYFPSDATVKVNKILLKKLTPENTEIRLKLIKEDVRYGDWDFIHIDTKKDSDCKYLFEKAIEDNYRVILATQLEIVNADNSSQKLTFYLNGVNGPLLHRAITEKDMNMIKAFCDYKLDVNTRNKAGWTSLHIAIDSEMSEVVDLLINNGADVNAVNSKRQVPLHYAVMRNNFRILDSLFKSQAKLDSKDLFRQTPLFYAVAAENVDVVDILLKEGADYTLIDDWNRTAFHLAAKQQSLEIIEVFLQNNVDVDILNNRRQTPFFFASETSFRTQSGIDHQERCLKIINVLLQKGANINFQDSDGRTPLHYAVINDNVEFMQTLLTYNADMSILTKSNQNILHVACWHQAKKSIQTLMNFDIDINAVDIKQKTVLHVTVETKNYDAVEIILNKNPNINMRDELGKTPMHLAIASECLSIIELLLKNGADVNLKDETGKIALHVASEKANIPIEIIKFILRSTHDINTKDNLGRTALHYAALSHNVLTLKYLLEENSDVNVKDLEGKTPLHLSMNSKNNHLNCVTLLLDHNADINAVDNDQTSPLLLAFFTKNFEVIEYLLRNGANSKMKDKDDKTAFHYACMFKLNGISISADDVKEHIEDILNLLVEEDVSVNCVDNFGKTPLHYVAGDKYLFMNKFLFNAGADINILDTDQNSPYDYFIRRWRHGGFEPLTLFKEHIIKMKVSKQWVCEKILDQVYNTDNEDNREWIRHYEGACSREVNLMKNTYISRSNITYYNFLKKSQHDAMNYTRNLNLVRAIQCAQLTRTFPIYDDFLKYHLRQVLRRSSLYAKIIESLQSYVFKKLPMLCVHEVFRYSDNIDFKMLLEALKPTVLGD